MIAEDLMIGDWVMVENRQCKVAVVHPDYIEVDIFSRGYFDNKDIFPIPLTPEILEKNGMHLYNRKTRNLMEPCNHCDCFEEDKDFRLELSLDNNGKIRWSINGDEYTIIPLDYVHQLQHAIRLCGIDKKIIL